VRVDARRGSEQYHSTKPVMRGHSSAFDCSKSGSARTRFGDCLFLLDFGMGGGSHTPFWCIMPLWWTMVL
jgi:hypothetical protein